MSALACTADTYTSREQWLAARRRGIGSSDAAAIVNVSPWHTPFTLFHEKLGLSDAPPAAREAAEWGTLLEPLLADRYARQTGRVVTYPGPYTIQRDRTHPYLLASVDRLVDDPEKGLGVLELKTCHAAKAGDWDDEPPLAYQVQVQHQLAVTGCTWASIAVLIGGQRFRWLDVERHEAFIETLRHVEAEFWARVEAHEPPPVDASDATRDLLKVLYPKPEPGRVVALPVDALAWDAQRCEAVEEIKKWEAQRQAAENQIKAAIGEAEQGIVDGITRYTWKASERKGYVVQPSTVRTLRRVVTNA